MEQQAQEEYIKAYNEFADAIFRHCYYRISKSDLAEDMVQNVFMKAWEFIERGNKVKNLRALLYKIANDLIIDEYRKKKTVSLDGLQAQGFDPEDGFGKKSLESILAGRDMIQLLGKLDRKYSEVVVMRYIDDLSPKEIAELIGETENNVSVRLNRAIKKIREII